MLIGIDVAKAELVVAARPSGERWTVANDERGVRTLVERLRGKAPEQYRSDKRDRPTAGTETVDPLEFLARLVTHIPNKHQVMTRYYGWYANRPRGTRRKATTDADVAAVDGRGGPLESAAPGAPRPRASPAARGIRRVAAAGWELPRLVRGPGAAPVFDVAD
ncbi:MAG: transposase [Gemmatimonadaceae bacterium]|nr:transposase [Gemmatimonadaceae bacterium]